MRTRKEDMQDDSMPADRGLVHHYRHQQGKSRFTILTLNVHLGHEGLGAPNGGNEDGGLHFLGKKEAQ
jgi:hypothetical protein